MAETKDLQTMEVDMEQIELEKVIHSLDLKLQESEKQIAELRDSFEQINAAFHNLKEALHRKPDYQEICVKPGYNVVMLESPTEAHTIWDRFRNVGMNTGNQVFREALRKELNIDFVSMDDIRSNKVKPKAIVTTDLIWILPDSNYDYLISRINELGDIPVVPIGVGLQASEYDKDFKLSQSAQRVLKMLEERVVIGCRGEYTAAVLEKYNIKNIQLIGCPSLYYKGSKGFSIRRNDTDIKNVVCNFRSLCGTLSKKEKRFLSWCTTGNYTFIEQTSQPFRIETVEGDRAYFEYVSKWIHNKKVFFELDSWQECIKKHDFSIGGRFHGNILALWNSIPALFVTVDSRTREMIDFFKLPYIEMEEFDWEKPIEYYYDLADYSQFNKEYRQKYENYVEFLKKNDIEEYLFHL